MILIKRKCLNCSRDFETINKAKLYCKESCASTFRNNKKKKKDKKKEKIVGVFDWRDYNNEIL